MPIFKSNNNQKHPILVMMKSIKIIICVACLIPLTSFTWYSATERLVRDYINTYAELAVIEMYRSGVPASITLAQGLHESNYGQSDLATRANNHFGIKCKSYWKGQKYYHEDDDFNTKGDLIESCFRAYNNPVESYVDHSNFLMYSSHYGKLFYLDKTDFKGWAYGLKECGYATDINYSKKLISKIEKYNLTQYDHSDNPYRAVIKGDSPKK